MNKMMSRSLSLLIAVVLLTSCSLVRDQKSSAAIQVEGEMTIAYSNLYSINGKNQYLSLRLVKGSYSEDWFPSPYMGRNWRGEFRLILIDDNGKELNHLNLNDYFTEELVFNDFFEIQFDDYNGDQAIDFTIGQYGTSNGNYYRLFTVTDNDEIQAIHIAEHDELFISGGNRYSMKLDKVDSHSFKTEHYNQAVGDYIETIFTWDGEKYIRTRL